jgi:hypothetical protein
LQVADPGAVLQDVLQTVGLLPKEMGGPVAPPRTDAVRVNIITCTRPEQLVARGKEFYYASSS